MFQTEFEFTLPCGYLDADGELHRHGVMRRATAADEIHPLRDPRVVKNPAFLAILLLSRVVVKLGSVEPITPKTIEDLFVTDLAFLQDLYNTVNDPAGAAAEVVCPHCRGSFVPEPAAPGGSPATPSTSSWVR
jgi:phage FluMu protein gp41